MKKDTTPALPMPIEVSLMIEGKIKDAPNAKPKKQTTPPQPYEVPKKRKLVLASAQSLKKTKV